jgi:hypothetical protein
VAGRPCWNSSPTKSKRSRIVGLFKVVLFFL